MPNATDALPDRPLPDPRFAAERDCLAHLYGNASDRPLRARFYATDLTDDEWQVVRRVMPVPGWLTGRGGNPEGFCHREMLDALRYFVDGGIKWRAMPADFPPWGAVYAFHRRRPADELLDVLHERLREQVRMVEGREGSRADCRDRRLPVPARRLHAGRGPAWIRRDEEVVMVTAADLQDRDAGVNLLARVRALFMRVQLVWADSGYAGALVEWARHTLALKVEVTRRGDNTAGFVVQPRRRVVERRFAWLMNCRRLVRDYERTAVGHETYVKWAMVTLMTRRLAAAGQSDFATPAGVGPSQHCGESPAVRAGEPAPLDEPLEPAAHALVPATARPLAEQRLRDIPHPHRALHATHELHDLAVEAGQAARIGVPSPTRASPTPSCPKPSNTPTPSTSGASPTANSTATNPHTTPVARGHPTQNGPRATTCAVVSAP